MNDAPATTERQVAPPEASEATGTVAGPVPAEAIDQADADGAAFGPLDDPPRVEGVELIGDPVDDPAAVQSPPIASGVAGVEDPDADRRLESSEAVSNPLMEPVGYFLPPDVMQRADEIGRETLAIAAHVAEIELANEATEHNEAMAAATTEPTGKKKES